MRFLERKQWAKLDKANEESARGAHENAARLLVSVAFMRENDDPRLAAEIYVRVAWARVNAGDMLGAQKAYELALTLSEDNHLFAAWVLSEKSAAYESVGAYQSAHGVLIGAAEELSRIIDPSPACSELIDAINSRAKSLAEKAEAFPKNGYPSLLLDSWLEDSSEGFVNIAN